MAIGESLEHAVYKPLHDSLITRIAEIRDKILWDTATEDEKDMMIADPHYVLEVITERLKKV